MPKTTKKAAPSGPRGGKVTKPSKAEEKNKPVEKVKAAAKPTGRATQNNSNSNKKKESVKIVKKDEKRAEDKPKKPVTKKATTTAEKRSGMNDFREALAAKGDIGTLLPWKNDALRPRFEELVASNLEQNFLERWDYYNSQGFLKSAEWVTDLMGEDHVAYAVVDDPNSDPYVFSIGLQYWFNLPEILIFAPDVSRDETGMMDLAQLLNIAAEALRRDPEAIQAGTSALSVWGPRFSDEGIQFEEGTDEDRETFMGSATWFQANFSDSFQFPVLKVTIPGGTIVDALTTSIYEAEGNRATPFKHGKVKKCPEPSGGNPEMANIFVLANKASNPPKAFASPKITDKDLFEEAPGVVAPAALKKILAQSTFDLEASAKALYSSAVFSAKFENIAVLAEAGVPLNGDGVNRSILMDAVQCGIEEGVLALVKAGAPLEETDYEAWTALSLGAFGLLHNDMDKAQRILKILWEGGARTL